MKKIIIILILIVLSGSVIYNLLNNEKNKEEVKPQYNDNNVEKIPKLPVSWQDNGIFKDYYEKAYEYLNHMTIDEKIGQMLLVRLPSNNYEELITNYHIGGYLLFACDFEGKNKNQVVKMIDSFQNSAKTPLLIAVDEEGGSVVRVSKNTKLRKTPFKSPQQLYKDGGYDLIIKDTLEKSKLLDSLGINLNLAPVADVSINKKDYIYDRSFGKNALETSTYIEKVIETGNTTNVSYTLKHFPGYGNNTDTHTEKSIDTRSYDDIMNNDILPFKAGIDKGAQAILVNHNTITSIDDLPASLSPKINQLLRNELKFTGIIITDDLYMGAIDNSYADNAAVLAVKAGNNILIVSDGKKDYFQLKNALANKEITEDDINQAVFKIIAWKYYKGILK